MNCILLLQYKIWRNYFMVSLSDQRYFSLYVFFFPWSLGSAEVPSTSWLIRWTGWWRETCCIKKLQVCWSPWTSALGKQTGKSEGSFQDFHFEDPLKLLHRTWVMTESGLKTLLQIVQITAVVTVGSDASQTSVTQLRDIWSLHA